MTLGLELQKTLRSAVSNIPAEGECSGGSAGGHFDEWPVGGLLATINCDICSKSLRKA